MIGIDQILNLGQYSYSRFQPKMLDCMNQGWGLAFFVAKGSENTVSTRGTAGRTAKRFDPPSDKSDLDDDGDVTRCASLLIKAT